MKTERRSRVISIENRQRLNTRILEISEDEKPSKRTEQMLKTIFQGNIPEIKKSFEITF